MTDDATLESDPPRSPALEAWLAQARRDLRASVPKPAPERLRARLSAEHRRLRWQRGATLAVLGLALASWGLSVGLHPVSSAVCPGMGAADVLLLGLAPSGAVLASMLALHSPHAGHQMLARGCWWSLLAMCTMAAFGAPGLLPVTTPIVALSSGAALLLMGRHGLRPENYRGPFRPLAHREGLTLIVVLSVADALTLVSINSANGWMHPIDDACAVVMLVAVSGLARLRTWGLLLNLAGNLAIMALALGGLLEGLPPPHRGLLVATAIAQLMLALPLLRTITRGRRRAARRSLHAAERLVILALMAAALGATVWTDPAARAEHCAQQCFQDARPAR